MILILKYIVPEYQHYRYCFMTITLTVTKICIHSNRLNLLSYIIMYQER